MAQMPVKPLIRLVDDEVDQLAALEMLLVGQGRAGMLLLIPVQKNF